MITFDVSEPGPARLAIYNVLGQMVRTLVDEGMTAGLHTVTWDGRDDRGKQLSSGLYLYRLEMRTKRVTHRMVMLK